MARIARSQLDDFGIWHVYSRGVDGCAIYLGDDDRHTFVRLLWTTSDRFGWQLHVYCLMTTHFHLVVEAARDALSGGMQRLNGRYAETFNEEHARTGHLFADRYSARVVPADVALPAVSGYVLNNPVRAGLCARAGDWPWSWSRYGDADAPPTRRAAR